MDMYSVGLTLDPTGIAQGARKGRAEFESVATAASNAEKKIATATSGMGAAARKIAGVFGIAVSITAATAAILGAVHAAQSYEKQMALVATVTDRAAISMATLSKGAMSIFRNLPVESMQEVTKGLYDIISSGIPAGDALQYLDVSARTAIAGVTSTAVAVDALTTATNAWSEQNLTATQAADQMFMAVNKGKITFEQLAGSMGLIASTASAYKISLADVLASAAQLTLAGMSAEMAMVGIRSAIVNVINPTGELAKAFPELAHEFNATKLEALGFTKFLLEFNKASGGSKEALNLLFTDIQGKAAVFKLLADNGVAVSNQLEAIEKSSGAMKEAFDLATNTSAALNQKLKNELTATIIELGQKALPLVNAGLKVLLAVLNAVNNIGRFRAEIETLALALGIAGLYGTIMKLLPAIRSLLFISGVTSAFTAAQAAGTGLVGVMWGLYGAARAYIIQAVAMRLHTLGIAPAFAAASIAGTGFTGVLYGLAGAARAAWLAINWPVALAIAGVTALIALFYRWRKIKQEEADEDAARAEEAENNRMLEYNAAMAKIAQRNQEKASVQTLTDETQRAVNQTLDAQQQEINKLAALKNAVGASQVTQALLNIEYERRAKLVENAVGHTKVQTDALNKQTNTIASLKRAMVLLNDEEERRIKLRDAKTENVVEVREAKTDSLLAGLAPAEAALQRIQLDRIAKIQDADQKYHDNTERATKAQTATEKKIHDDKVAAINEETTLKLEALEKEKRATTRRNVESTIRDTEDQVRGVIMMADAELRGAGATEQARVALAGLDAVQRAVNEARSRGTTLTGDEIAALRQSAEAYERIQVAIDRIRAIKGVVGSIVEGILTQQIKTFDDFVRKLRDVAIHVLSDVITNWLTKALTDFLGKIGPDKAALKQIAAGQTMLQAAQLQNAAADKMLQASGQQAPSTPTQTPSPADPNAFGWKQAAGSAVLGGLAGYSAAQSLYSTSHGQAGNMVRGALGGAASGAAAGAAVGGAPGAIVGAVAGFIGGIIGVGKASKEAEKQLHAMQVQIDQNIASLKAEVTGDRLGQAVEQIEEARESMRKAIEDAYPGGSREKVRYEKMDEMNALMDRRIELEKEAIALEAKRTQEDYRVRLLAAEGHTQEAEAMKYQLDQERELADLRKSFGDVIDPTEAATYAIAEQALAAEKLAHDAAIAAGEIGGLTTAVRNSPAGFKVNSYIQQYATPATLKPATPTSRLTPSDRPLTNPIPTTTQKIDAKATTVYTFPNATFRVDGSKTPAQYLTDLAKELKQRGAATDPSAMLSDVLDSLQVN